MCHVGYFYQIQMYAVTMLNNKVLLNLALIKIKSSLKFQISTFFSYLYNNNNILAS